MSVIVKWPGGRIDETTPEAMASKAGRSFSVDARVPGAEGEGFALLEWYGAASEAADDRAAPTHLIVRAADGFQAVIPWDQLGQALLQYAVNGRPLERGRPMRLYVPDGSSACLNVKSVTELRIARDAEFGDEAGYGFVNEISPGQLREGLKIRD
ncbi:molybdopterin-dependent oxidoreductase [Cohnella nanjingensis]|uniref:Molybdopterin-dependent oxidoreductase n=1 Tax=Cohnella nanjingensis TaxID=1387779 RepID=A0A7X0RTX4_9BACL|nr:molybdopterin-dependent oxidoreductase [Cohnella nanjingensis]MBB6672345.1 molybdopterin-dependent oxidoreductase [Cohnella nanjingensis]